MTDRRFTNVAELDPRSVRSLPITHPAMVEDRTLFPSTVVDVTRDNPDRLLVSGVNNRKLGGTIIKGQYSGYALYGLSLEERATCPLTCSVRGFCYGNGMQMARRHRIVDEDVFFDRMQIEIEQLLKDDARGLMIRLHVLGDFPSVNYVAFWSDILNEYDRVACYGYTHRKPKDEIGAAVASVKEVYPDRFRIRWSSDTIESDAATVINYVPQSRIGRIPQGILCPAQTETHGCCASCGLCWEPKAKHDNIVFILHGPKSGATAAEAAMAEIAEAQTRPRELAPPVLAAPPPAPRPPVVSAEPSVPPVAPVAPTPRPASPPVDTRFISGISIPAKVSPNQIEGGPPEMRMVFPSELSVEAAYQRDLSGRSVTLIRKIVSGWDWSKFKPPVCAETEHGLFVIDGQHTAIAAASHPGVEKIPVMVVGAERLEERADAFVAHNRDRLAMSALQIFHAEVAAGSKDALAISAAITKAGANVPRSMPSKHDDAKGKVVAINEARAILKGSGASHLERVVRIATLARVNPISQTVLRAVRMLLSEQRFSDAARLSDAELARALGSIQNIEFASQRHAAATGQGRYRACVMLILDALKVAPGKAA